MSSDAFERLAVEFPDSSDLAIELFDLLKEREERCEVDVRIYANFLGNDEYDIRLAMEALSAVGLVNSRRKYLCPYERCECRIPMEDAVRELEDDGALSCPLCQRELEIARLEDVTDYVFDPIILKASPYEMPLNQAEQRRMNDLLELMDLDTEKLGTLQKSRATKSSASQNFEDDQEIRATRRRIAEYQQEFADLAARDSRIDRLKEEEAQVIVNAIKQSTQALENAPQAADNPEVMAVLTEIKAKLDKPAPVASAKLKVLIPLIPKLSRLELEWDLSRSAQGAMDRLKSILGMRSK